MSQDLDRAMKPINDALKQFEEDGVPIPESPARLHKRLTRYVGIYPEPNLAVELCDRSFADAAKEALNKGKSQTIIRRVGRIAFCSALPKLSGANNIRDFIACVTHAMALEIIPSSEGSRLLYAAQVAHMALTKRPKKRNKSSLTHTSDSEATTTKSRG
jgi:hypothetical protein